MSLIDFARPKRPQFRYPVHGVGRSEYMVPFQRPFNESGAALHQNSELHSVLFDLFQSRFKLELMTVITSHAGVKQPSSHQRWHQAYKMPWHAEERLPPFAVVVAVPLVDVDLTMGPTQLCPRKKLRFYQGYTCPENAAAFESTLEDVLIFDYKLLHRAPKNESPRDRPMVSRNGVLPLVSFLQKAPPKSSKTSSISTVSA